MPPCEHDVAAVADIPADGMLGVIAGEQSVLLTRVGSAVYAVGGTCPHARGPLVEGVRQNDHVICPWHKASFCLRTGALVDPPAMDALPRFATRVAQGRVLVSVPPRNICDLTLQQCSDHPRFALTLIMRIVSDER